MWGKWLVSDVILFLTEVATDASQLKLKVGGGLVHTLNSAGESREVAGVLCSALLTYNAPSWR